MLFFVAYIELGPLADGRTFVVGRVIVPATIAKRTGGEIGAPGFEALHGFYSLGFHSITSRSLFIPLARLLAKPGGQRKVTVTLSMPLHERRVKLE